METKEVLSQQPVIRLQVEAEIASRKAGTRAILLDSGGTSGEHCSLHELQTSLETKKAHLRVRIKNCNTIICLVVSDCTHIASSLL